MLNIYSLLFKKDGLIYEWTFNNSFVDTVKCIPLTPVGNVPFVENSVSISSSSYLTAPVGQYFFNNFTVAVWVYYLKGYFFYERIFDFYVEATNLYQIQLTISQGSSGLPWFYVNSGSSGNSQTLLFLY